MSDKKIPKHCKNCEALWTKSVVPWCCAKGDEAKKSIGHCKLHNLKRSKGNE
jgi:hypothetical protein